MIQRELANIPFSKLILTDINMRHAKKAPEIADILPSIRERGILQSLLVRPNGDQFEVAAGRRRYFCLKAISAESGEDITAPCLVLEEGDDAAAIEASLLENVARQDADEMTQYETFARLLSEGKTPADIARTFGLEIKTVEKRLALGHLDPAIRDLYRQERIGVDEVRLLTLASKRNGSSWQRPASSRQLGS
jgi:ParB family chromosome partitioning protein